jgi:REP-associated tyrosine transposase
MPKAFYRRNLPHLQCDQKPHFLTFCTYKRRILPDWARSIVLDACLRANGTTVQLHVAVVMPDHVHLIFVPLIDLSRSEVISLARITKAIKGASSHLINRRLNTHERIWQEESFDHVLRSSEQLDAKIEYVRNNPVRKGLVATPDEYRWTWVADPELGRVVPLRMLAAE